MTMFKLSVSDFKFTRIFLLPLIFVHFRPKNSFFSESIFPMTGTCCIPITDKISFIGYFSGNVSTTRRTPNFDFSVRRSFLLSVLFLSFSLLLSCSSSLLILIWKKNTREDILSQKTFLKNVTEGLMRNIFTKYKFVTSSRDTNSSSFSFS